MADRQGILLAIKIDSGVGLLESKRAHKL